MKKILNFMVNTKNGQKIFLTTCTVIFSSLIIGLILSAPMFWMGNTYESTWMNSIAPYFFYAFFAYAALMVFLFMPYMWHVGTSTEYTGSSRMILKGMAIFCSIVPGGFIYSFFAKALWIPTGPHNIIGMLIFGFFYLLIMKTILKKPFNVIQEFIPLT
jgi:hypothetical protein